jgi:type I restriction enzyme, S subunit
MTGLMTGPIRDFALGIYDGPHATPRESHEGPIFLGIRNVSPDGRLDLSDIRHVSEQDFPRWTRRVMPQKDDIVFSYEATLHRYAMIPEDFRGCLGRRMALVRPDTTKVVPRFLHYFFLSQEWRALVESNVITGATVDRIPIKRFPDFEVKLPSLDTQKHVANTLSAYDDLVENNRRRIALLEQAARLLYKEWFVRLRFPGHEHVKIKDGVPELWEKVPISSFCSVRRGASPRPINNFLGGRVPWFKISDATASESPFVLETKELVTEDGAGRSVLLPPEELILSNSATCGIPNFTGVSGCIHDGWLYFQNLERVDKWFLYCCLFEKQKELLQGIGEGATQKNFNTEYVGCQLVLLPNKLELLTMFRQNIEPMFKQIFLLTKSNNLLSKARNLLLPRLMNGELAV